jgi:hypothetical protein
MRARSLRFGSWLAVWLYQVFRLGPRDVGLILAEPGMTVTARHHYCS